MYKTPDTYVKIFEIDGEFVYAQSYEEQRIDAAVELWVSSNKTRDSILKIDLIDGLSYNILASRIASWFLSTPEYRERRYKVVADQEEEHKTLSSLYGDPEPTWE